MSFRPTVFAHIVGPASTTDLFLCGDWTQIRCVDMERFFWFPAFVLTLILRSTSRPCETLQCEAMHIRKMHENAASMNSED